MQTILVPTDFSPEARNAGSHAAELAKAFNSRILLFHAYMLPTPVSEVPYVMVTVDDLQKENEGLIKKEADTLNSQYGVEVEWVVRIGIPSDEIRALTEERKIDLVVMGMKGVGGFNKIIGSTTTNSIRKVRTPVLIVPQDARFAPVGELTFASDLHFELFPESFGTVRDIASKFNSNIHVVHVRKPNSQLSIDLNDWESHVQSLFGDKRIDITVVEDENIHHGINDFIQRSSTNVLIMIAHRHTFFERLFNKSQTTAMVYETRIPLLILHQR